MATMEIINDLCKCGARATRMIRDKEGRPVELTCTKDATAALTEQMKKEREEAKGRDDS